MASKENIDFVIKKLKIIRISHNKCLFDIYTKDNSYFDYDCGATGRKKLCKNVKCLPCYKRSFASIEKSRYWSKYNDVSSRDTFLRSGIMRMFDCPICKHEFEMHPNNASRNHWCPYCQNQKLCESKDCQMCRGRSFQIHEKSKFWSKKNKRSPSEVFLNTHTEFIFDCPSCNHEFKMALNGINDNRWCPYCSSTKLCSEDDCEPCYYKSFESHNRSKFWSKKNKKCSGEVFLNSHILYIFDCEYGHEFKMTPAKVNSERWCPQCKHKTEAKLFDYLKTQYNDTISQIKFDWCRNELTNKFLPLDFYIPSLNLVIELDGPQHFEQISTWKKPEYTRSFDVYKMEQCLTNGISIVRILQDDVFNDYNDWKKNISEVLKVYIKPVIIYLCDDDIYDEHKQDMSYVE